MALHLEQRMTRWTVLAVVCATVGTALAQISSSSIPHPAAPNITLTPPHQMLPQTTQAYGATRQAYGKANGSFATTQSYGMTGQHKSDVGVLSTTVAAPQFEAEEQVTTWQQSLRWHWCQGLMYAMGAFIFSVLYKARVVDNLPKLEAKNRRGFDRLLPSRVWRQTGLFSCLGNMDTCPYVCFCPMSVSAKNFDRADIMRFWPACALLFCTYSVGGCAGAIMRTILSTKLKEHLNIEHNIFTDCCLNCFCLPCEVGRESLFVDEELGVEIKCFLEIEGVRTDYE